MPFPTQAHESWAKAISARYDPLAPAPLQALHPVSLSKHWTPTGAEAQLQGNMMPRHSAAATLASILGRGPRTSDSAFYLGPMLDGDVKRPAVSGNQQASAIIHDPHIKLPKIVQTPAIRQNLAHQSAPGTQLTQLSPANKYGQRTNSGFVISSGAAPNEFQHNISLQKLELQVKDKLGDAVLSPEHLLEQTDLSPAMLRVHASLLHNIDAKHLLGDSQRPKVSAYGLRDRLRMRPEPVVPHEPNAFGRLFDVGPEKLKLSQRGDGPTSVKQNRQAFAGSPNHGDLSQAESTHGADSEHLSRSHKSGQALKNKTTHTAAEVNSSASSVKPDLAATSISPVEMKRTHWRHTSSPPASWSTHSSAIQNDDSPLLSRALFHIPCSCIDIEQIP